MKLINSTLAAFRAVRVNKLRSSLTMLGIVLGVSSVIVMVAVGAGTQQRIQDEIRGLGTNIAVLDSGAATKAGVRQGAGSKPSVTLADAQAIQHEFASVLSAAPQVNAARQMVNGNANWAGPVVGTTPEYFEIRGWRVINGRFFEREDVEEANKVVLLGRTVVEELFNGQNPVGQEIRINHVPVVVIGELARKGQSMTGVDQDNIVILPITTAMNRIIGRNPANPRALAGVVMKFRDGVSMTGAMEEVRQMLRVRHHLEPTQEDDFQINNLSEVLKVREDSSRALGVLLAAIASVSLLVGGIGIMNIMLVSISERTSEIGLRLAVGARRSDILGQFLVEATTLCLIGGVAGLALGVVGALMIEQYADMRVAIEADLSLIAMGFSAAVGIFFGLYPAWKASLLQPVEALRSA
jgi:putative ABC transport system permease protein